MKWLRALPHSHLIAPSVVLVVLPWIGVLAAGRFHLYLHGKQNIWDYAAGYLVFNEVGGQSCTLQAEPVFDFSLNPRSAVAALDNQLFNHCCHYLGINI